MLVDEWMLLPIDADLFYLWIVHSKSRGSKKSNDFSLLILKVSIDDSIGMSIDTTTKLSIANPSIELYRAVGHKICSDHILASLLINTNAVSSIDSPSSPRQLPLAR
ncbi:hypothetical protein F2Q69_00029219 [Brassica cretica]|uniref:Uncharacterized protein n=1 Tax=Brassica cretica TaxID=69181 RepID=A0A8S9S4W7_BRACR|nr:hypothetical protein F2Q69_00029219 [Brassica cretica]